MKKILKITGLTLSIIIVLMIVLPFIFKGKIMEIVKKEANEMLTAEVNFKKIGLNLFSNFPALSVNIKEVSVIGRDTFKGDTLIYAKKIGVSVNLMSLFGNNGIEVRKITIDRPVVHLFIDHVGNANWDIVKPSDKKDDKQKSKNKTDEESSSSFKLSIKNLSITKGDIIYNDKKGNLKMIAHNLNFNLSGDLTADLVTLKTKLGIEKTSFIMSGIPYMSKAKIHFKGDIKADLKNNKYTFQKNELNLNALGLCFSGWMAMPKDGIDMDISLQLLKSDFKNFLSLIPALYAKDFKKIETAGTLALSASAKGKMIGDIYPAFHLNIQIENAMFRYPDLPKSVENIQILTNISSPGGTLDNATIDLNKFHVEMGGNPLDIKLLLQKPISNPTFDFTANGKIDLNTVKDFYPLDETDITGLLTANLVAKGDMASIDAQKYDNLNVKGGLELANGKIKSDIVNDNLLIDKFKLDFTQRYVHLATTATIGKNDLKADGALENVIGYVLNNDVIKGQLKLNSNYLNINELLGDENPEEKSKASKKEPPVSGETPEIESIPMSVIEIPKNIDFMVNVSIKQLVYDHFDLRQVLGTVTVKDQILDFKNLSMKTLGGDMKVAGIYNVQNPIKPEVNMKINMNNVDVQQTARTFVTVQKLLPIIHKTNGRISMDFEMKTLLDNTMSPIYNTLNATGKVFSNGLTIENVEVFNKISDALKMDKLRKLTLDAFNFSFTCKNGRIITQPFDIKFGNIKASVSGSTGLDETIDYNINSKIPRSELGTEANKVIANLGTNVLGTGVNVTLPEIIELPIGVGGTFKNPTVKLGAVGNTGKALVKDVVEQVVEQGKEIVKEQITIAVEEAKKQKEKLIAEAQKQKDALVKQAQVAGKNLVLEADKQGQALIKKAGNNPVAKKAAEESAKKLKQEAQKKSDNLVKDAENEGNNLVSNAEKIGNDLIKKAE
ncbi:MAG: hypothetical protein FWF70_00710 [Bacteroidetes bacterium]|nr:hypothetical protein [Bacteroidota bacterium]MCL1969757.1 hypothetical protein [Bacteroidota bacterium]